MLGQKNKTLGVAVAGLITGLPQRRNDWMAHLSVFLPTHPVYSLPVQSVRLPQGSAELLLKLAS